MQVKCAYDKMVDITALVPNPLNPNKHPASQLQLLAKIMAHQGWRSPVVVSERSGFITKGHGRLLAAKLNGWTEVPVDYQAYTNEADEYADMVADNKIAELAHTDMGMVNDYAVEMPASFDFALLGIPEFKPVKIEVTQLPNLPSGERSPFQQMTFTLHDDQVEQVQMAIDVAIKMGKFDTENENSNGNALARICETFMTEHGIS